MINTFSIPQQVVGGGRWVTGGVQNPTAFPNPRALTANLIESGALTNNYPAPSMGMQPVRLPVGVAPPLNGWGRDGSAELGGIGADLWSAAKIVGGSLLVISLATWAATRLAR